MTGPKKDFYKRPIFWVFVSPTISFVLLLITMIFYVNSTNQQNDQRWCALMTNLDKRYQSAAVSPPPTATPEQVRNLKTTAQQFHELTLSLGCNDN